MHQITPAQAESVVQARDACTPTGTMPHPGQRLQQLHSWSRTQHPTNNTLQGPAAMHTALSTKYFETCPSLHTSNICTAHTHTHQETRLSQQPSAPTAPSQLVATKLPQPAGTAHVRATSPRNPPAPDEGCCPPPLTAGCSEVVAGWALLPLPPPLVWHPGPQPGTHHWAPHSCPQQPPQP